MMGFSCVNDVYERTCFHHCPWQRKILLLYPTFRCITHKKVGKPAKETPHKEISVDPIRSDSLPCCDETVPLRKEF